MAMSYDFRIVPADLSSFSRLSEMYQACFGVNPGEAYFRWKYLENPAGRVVAFEARQGEQLAAFYGLLPEALELEGQPLLCYQSMDTMTHPDFQRRGLFTRTAQAALQHLADREGRARLYGIPGARSLPGFRKLGWRELPPLPLIFQHSTLLRALAPQEVAVRRIDCWEPCLDQYFSSKARAHGPIRRALNPEYLQWRVFDHPMTRLELHALFSGSAVAGICLSRRMTPSRSLVYLLEARDPELACDTGRSLLAGLARERFGWIYAWQTEDAGFGRAFESLGFLRNPLGLGPFSHRVPRILHQLGSERDWGNASIDWQPIMQD